MWVRWLKGKNLSKNDMKKKIIQARMWINAVCNDADHIDEDGLAKDFSFFLTNIDAGIEEFLSNLEQDK